MGSLEEDVASCPIVEDFSVSYEYLLYVGFPITTWKAMFVPITKQRMSTYCVQRQQYGKRSQESHWARIFNFGF